uniref:Uncharacterized protein n=1 Tax=Oryza glumipatula TaxID=40148 RepID=A0A0D9YWL4_9ORYZ
MRFCVFSASKIRDAWWGGKRRMRGLLYSGRGSAIIKPLSDTQIFKILRPWQVWKNLEKVTRYLWFFEQEEEGL